MSFMSLTKTDLKSIKELIDDSIETNNKSIKGLIDSSIEKNNVYLKDLIEYTATQTEDRLGARMDKIEKTVDNLDKKVDNLDRKLDREIEDIAEMNREFVSRFDNHEDRIGRLELETGMIVK